MVEDKHEVILILCEPKNPVRENEKVSRENVFDQDFDFVITDFPSVSVTDFVDNQGNLRVVVISKGEGIEGSFL